MAWANTTKAVYLCENNRNDSSGNNFTSEQFGVAAFSTTQAKEGSYSLFVNNAYNLLYAPQGLINLIAADTVGYSWEAWVWDDKGNREFSGAYPFAGGNSTKLRLALNTSNGLNLVWNGSGVYALGNYNYATEAQTWIHWAWSYDVQNDRLKVYKNGNLIYTLNSAGNAFNGTTISITSATSSFDNFKGYLDRIIFNVGIVATTFPTQPLADGAKGIYTFGMPKTRFKKQRLGAI